MNQFILEIDKTYIADLLDDEGNILIIKKFKANCKKPYMVYASDVNIVNTNLEVLKWVQEKTHIGIIFKIELKCYQWRIPVYQQAEFLKTILPNLTMKNRQAEILIEYDKIRLTRETKHLITKELEQQYEKFYQEISQQER